jgi:hypothetical protein
VAHLLLCGVGWLVGWLVGLLVCLLVGFVCLFVCFCEGCIIYVLICGALPFDAINEHAIAKKIRSANYKYVNVCVCVCVCVSQCDSVSILSPLSHCLYANRTNTYLSSLLHIATTRG